MKYLPSSSHVIVAIAFAVLLFSAASANAQNVALQPQPRFSFVPADDGAPGSTMTLQQLQQAQKKAEELPPPLKVVAASEPVPALKYRFYPARWELKPGSALLHFARAQILYKQMPDARRTEWNKWLEEDSSPSLEQLGTAVGELQDVLKELHELAMSESFEWDHRVRDLRGPEVYLYLLPDVQETRAMMRVLQLKIQLSPSAEEFRRGDLDDQRRPEIGRVRRTG